MGKKCACSGGQCLSCACSKAGRTCRDECHGGGTNLQCCNIQLSSGIDVMKMSAGEVRTELIKRDLFNLDDSGPQLKALLLRTLSLEERTCKPSAASSKAPTSKARGADEMDSDGDESDGDEEVDPVAIAKRILAVATEDLDVLNVLQSFPSIAKGLQTKKFTEHTPAAEVKKVYRYLASQIHPDKLQRKFQDATKAFQALVSAYDHFAQGSIVGAMSARRGSDAIDLTITRSNTNCYSTPVYCPRCRVEWNQRCDGLEKIAYTLMMTGLQCFHCSTCLLEFGAITAIHRCPHCKSKHSEYEYSPEDFNRQIQCVNKSCDKKFGFMLTVIPQRRMNELRESLKSALEKRHAAQSTKDSRSNRALKRRVSEVDYSSANAEEEDEEDEGEAQPTKKQKLLTAPAAAVVAKPKKMSEMEKAFSFGLLDACPRCGFSPEGEQTESTLLAHLNECTDKKKHAKYAAEQKAFHEKQNAKAAKKAKEVDTMSSQTWKFLGATKETSWMLTSGAVETQLRLKGVETTGSIAQNFAAFQATMSRVTPRLKADPAAASGDVAASSSGVLVVRQASVKAAAKISAASLPSNLHTCSRTQLLSILASHDLLRSTDDDATKDELIERLSARVEGREEEPMEIDPPVSKPKAKPSVASRPPSSILVPPDLESTVNKLVAEGDAATLSVNTILSQLSKKYGWNEKQRDEFKPTVRPMIKAAAEARMKE